MLKDFLIDPAFRASFEHFAARTPASSPPFPIQLTPAGEKLVNFVIIAGVVLNLLTPFYFVMLRGIKFDLRGLYRRILGKKKREEIEDVD